jgi:hypothetical protein
MRQVMHLVRIFEGIVKLRFIVGREGRPILGRMMLRRLEVASKFITAVINAPKTWRSMGTLNLHPNESRRRNAGILAEV